MKQVGIIGFGAFGRLLAEILSPHAEVLVYDKTHHADLPTYVRLANIPEIAETGMVIVATDLEGIEEICQQLSSCVNSATLVMDICSVKEQPQDIMQRELGSKCRVLATHPLFGPQSVASNGGTRGLKMVLCSERTGDYPEVSDLFRRKLGIDLICMTAQVHDKEMAWVHGLTFFVGRALMNMDVSESELKTHYYQKLLDLVELEKQHSEALFMTIQRGNRHTKAVRKALIKKMEALDKQIDKNMLV